MSDTQTPLPPPIRSAVLSEASALICGDRQRDYGDPSGNFGHIAGMWNGYMDRCGLLKADEMLQSSDVATMMALLKIARIAHGPSKRDSYVDACGYLALAAELAMAKT